MASRLNAQVGSKADVGVTAMVSRSGQQRSPLEQRIRELMATYTSMLARAATIGRRTSRRAVPASGIGLGTVDAILTDYYSRVTADATHFTTAVSLNWRPAAWLTANADAGLDLIPRDDTSLLPRGAAGGTVDSAGVVGAGRGSSLVSTINLRITSIAPLGWGFRLEASLGANYTLQRTADLSVSGRNLTVGGTSVGQAAQLVSS